MQNLSLNEIIANIEQGICFEATHNGDFEIKVQEYVPFICTAIHDGHRLREELVDDCLLNEDERFYEEDPYTGEFIRSLPITLIGGDSRYEYDLNRSPEHCIYDVAWGKKVWKSELPEEKRKRSLEKHSNFYSVVHALVSRLEKVYKSCVIYDLHSYNHQRHDVTFLFNIGIENIDIKKYNSEISSWKKELTNIKIKKHKVDVSVNNIFFGRGYLLEYIESHFNNSLVLATEVKKVFMNELTGQPFPMIIQSIAKGLKDAIIRNSQKYINKRSILDVPKKGNY